MTHSIRKVVVLGANGTMGAASAAMFSGAGIHTVLLARTQPKAAEARSKAETLLRGKPIRPMAIGAYATDLARELADADLVLECLAEDYATKHDMFAVVDRVRRPGTIVATVTSGLSIHHLAAGRSADFRSCFLGVHLFNPPTMIRGCELIPHMETDLEVFESVRAFLTALDREVVVTDDSPGFAGNRIGFRVLNECAQLAEMVGPARLDMLLGTHTGRALAPLATIDLVGWDVHRAIVDNLYAHTSDEARQAFVLPVYMLRGIAAGCLGRKTGRGFFRVEGKKPDQKVFALEPGTDDYRLVVDVPPPPFVARMKIAHKEGRPDVAMGVLCDTDDPEAIVVKRFLVGYASYALGRVGEVVETVRDVDRIMQHGFAWSTPSSIVNALGLDRAIALMDEYKLPVPEVVKSAADRRRPLAA